jgi:hypothetical protein
MVVELRDLANGLDPCCLRKVCSGGDGERGRPPRREAGPRGGRRPGEDDHRVVEMPDAGCDGV